MFFVCVLLAFSVCCTADNHQFLVLTDPHIADDYVEGSDPNTFCTEGKGSAGYYGHYNCDSPINVFSSSLKFAKNIEPLDFVVWLGDSPTKYLEHPKHNQTTEHIMENVERVATLISNAFPNTTVFPTLGNHDHNPDDAFGPNEKEYLEQIAKIWSRWLPDDALDTVRHGGYYWMPVPGVQGLHIVSLNTLYWSATNSLMTNVTGDVAGQFMWLEKVLHVTRALGEKIIVIGHIPPIVEVAANQWRPDYYDMYANLLSLYADVVTANIFGHMHQDLFSVIAATSASSNLLSPAMVVPGITPRASSTSPDKAVMPGKNPCIRVYSYDSTHLIDYTQYYADIDQANTYQRPLEWVPDYSFCKEYGVPDLSSSSLNGLAKRLVNNQDDWCKFYNHLFVHRLCSSQSAHDLIRRGVVCSTLYTTLSEYATCASSTLPLFNCN